MNQEEFYIGYLEKAPPGIRRFTRRTVITILAITVVAAVILVVGQQAFYPSTFEFLVYRTFEGTVQERPYPMLRVLRPGDTGEWPTYSHYYLVNEGKFGVREDVAGLDGQRVRLEGALIYRDDQVMIEVKPGTLEPLSNGELPTPAPAKTLGMFTMPGEIVDSKCFLGVMNPGNHKPHRACAARCISGGIPPMFYVKDAEGRVSYLLLQSESGAAVNQEVLNMIAEPLEITGTVIQDGDVLVLRADPAGYRHVGSN